MSTRQRNNRSINSQELVDFPKPELPAGLYDAFTKAKNGAPALPVSTPNPSLPAHMKSQPNGNGKTLVATKQRGPPSHRSVRILHAREVDSDGRAVITPIPIRQSNGRPRSTTTTNDSPSCYRTSSVATTPSSPPLRKEFSNSRRKATTLTSIGRSKPSSIASTCHESVSRLLSSSRIALADTRYRNSSLDRTTHRSE